MTGRLLALAVRLLPRRRGAWGEAMRADFAALQGPADRRRFAFGCLRVAVTQAGALRGAAYLAIEAATLGFAASKVSGALLVEIAGLVVLVPPAFWWIGSGSGALALGPQRSARVGRRAGYGLLAACVLVMLGFISAEILPRADAGPDAGALVLGVLVFVLALYAVAIFGATTATSGVSAGALAWGAAFGAVAGLAGFALAPFNQSYAVHGPWLSVVYPAALAFVVVGAPAGAAALVARRTRNLGQGVHAGTCTGVVGALTLFIVGVAAIWLRPELVDSRQFDKGADWLPPAAITVAATYVLTLALLPLLAAGLAGLGAAIGAPSGRRRLGLSRAHAALAGVALAGVLCVPVKHTLLDGRDRTSFGVVGTTSVEFSPTGRALLTSNAEQTAILWKLNGLARPTRVETFRGGAVFSSDGRWLATRGLLWNVADPAHPTRMAAFDDGDPAAFSADARLLSTDKNGEGMVWDLSDRVHPKRLGTFTGQWAAFSPDGRTFATSAACWWDSPATLTRCGTTLWSASPGRRPSPLVTIGGGDAVFSPDRRTVATRADDGTVVLWSLADMRHPARIATLETGDVSGSPSAVVFSWDGRVLATGGGNGVVRLWSVADPARVAVLPPARPFPNSGQIGASSTLTTVAFSRDGRTLTTVMGNNLATRWNVAGLGHPVRQAVLTRQTQGAGQLGFSPDATVIAGAAVDGSNNVSLWRVR